MKRGIIATPNKLKRIDEKSVTFSSNLTIQDLNYQILYWDKLVFPTNNMIHLGIPNEDLLIRENILTRPRVIFPSWSTNIEDGSFDLFIRSQSVVANELIKNDKNFDWTLHQIGDEIIIGAENKTEFNSIKVQLLQALPVPNEKTPIEDILRFKEQRADEFAALHKTLDNLYLEILKSPDKSLQTKISVQELTEAIRNLNSVSSEKFALTSKYNLTTELNVNVKNMLTGIASGAAFGFYANLQILPLTSILGGLMSLINIKLNKTTSVEEAKNKLKLNYLSDAKKQNIV